MPVRSGRDRQRSRRDAVYLLDPFGAATGVELDLIQMLSI
jgi:hypothetical protein